MLCLYCTHVQKQFWFSRENRKRESLLWDLFPMSGWRSFQAPKTSIYSSSSFSPYVHIRISDTNTASERRNELTQRTFFVEPFFGENDLFSLRMSIQTFWVPCWGTFKGTATTHYCGSKQTNFLGLTLISTYSFFGAPKSFNLYMAFLCVSEMSYKLSAIRVNWLTLTNVQYLTEWGEMVKWE